MTARDDSGASALRHLIMCADRSRFGSTLLVLLVVHVPLSVLTKSLSASSMLSMTAVLVAHRALIVRLVPQLPRAGTLTLASYIYTRTLVAAMMAPLLCFLSVAASLACHGQPLMSCSSTLSSEALQHAAEGSASCSSPLAYFSASWSVTIGLVGVVQYLCTPSLCNLHWPLLQQDSYLRLRRHLQQIITRAACTTLACAACFIMVKWTNQHFLLTFGATLIHLRCGVCVPELSNGSLADGFLLLIRAGCYLTCLNITLQFASISYTQPLAFVSMDSSINADPDAALKLALTQRESPLTQHLAFLDVFSLSEYSPRRRASLFAAQHGAGECSRRQLLLLCSRGDTSHRAFRCYC